MSTDYLVACDKCRSYQRLGGKYSTGYLQFIQDHVQHGVVVVDSDGIWISEPVGENAQSLASRVLKLLGQDHQWRLKYLIEMMTSSPGSLRLIEEAIRCESDDPIRLAADVLIVLMGITQKSGIDWSTVEARASQIVSELGGCK